MTDTNDPQGGPDFSALLAQAQAMQQQLLEAQASVADREIEGQAGGGLVKVRCTGALDFTAVRIAPDAIDPDDTGMLEDLVLAAVRDCVAQANRLNQQALGGFGNLGGLLP